MGSASTDDLMTARSSLTCNCCPLMTFISTRVMETDSLSKWVFCVRGNDVDGEMYCLNGSRQIMLVTFDPVYAKGVDEPGLKLSIYHPLDIFLQLPDRRNQHLYCFVPHLPVGIGKSAPPVDARRKQLQPASAVEERAETLRDGSRLLGAFVKTLYAFFDLFNGLNH